MAGPETKVAGMRADTWGMPMVFVAFVMVVAVVAIGLSLAVFGRSR